MSQDQLQAFAALVQRCDGLIDHCNPSQAAAELERWIPRMMESLGPTHGLILDATILLSRALLDLDRMVEAERCAKGVLAALRQETGDPVRRITAKVTLARVYLSQERPEETRGLLEEAIEDVQAAAEAGREDLFAALEQLSGLLAITGCIDIAIDIHRMIADRFRELTGPASPAVAFAMRGEALLLARQELYDQATQKLSAAIQIAEALCPGETSIVELRWRDELATIFEAAGRVLEAEVALKKLLERCRTLAASDPARIQALHRLASFMRGQKRFAEAEPVYRQALEVAELAGGPEHPDRAACLNNLGTLMTDTGRYDEAEKLLLEALDLGRRTMGEDHPTYGVDLLNLAYLRLNQGRTADAEQLYQRGIAIWEKAIGPYNKQQISARWHLAEICQMNGRAAEAEKHLKTAIDSTLLHFGAGSPAFFAATSKLIDLRRAQGRMLDTQEILCERTSYLRRSERIRGDEQEVALGRVRSDSPWDLAALQAATSGWVRPGVLWQRRRLAKACYKCLATSEFEAAWLLSKRIFLERAGDISQDEYQLLLGSGKLVGLERAIHETEPILAVELPAAARPVLVRLLEKWCLFLADFEGCLKHAEAHRTAWPDQYRNEIDNDIAYCLTQKRVSLDRAYDIASEVFQRVRQEGSKADHVARACVADTLGFVLLRLGKPVDARPLLQTAQDEDPAIIHAFHLAEALYQTGNHENARLLLSKLLELEAQFVEERAIQAAVSKAAAQPEKLWS